MRSSSTSIFLSSSCIILITITTTFLSLTTPTFASESLTVTSPPGLFPQYPGNVIPERPSLFGLPNYLKKLSGQLIYPDNSTLGCSGWAQNAWIPSGGGDPNPNPINTIIPLIDRGNCSFAQKVMNAQTSGASAAIICNGPLDSKWLPFMAAPEDSGIKIPAMIISYADCQVLKNKMNVKGGIQVTMDYFLPNPDDRVEIDYFTAASNHPGNKFQRQFRTVVETMKEHVLFTPRYLIRTQYLDGWYPTNCYPDDGDCSMDNLPCGNQCTNCGHYCAYDPDGNITSGASGADVIVEQLRQKCVWMYGNSSNVIPNTKWFDYLTQHDAQCVSTGKSFDTDCSLTIINGLGITTDWLNNCIGTVGVNTDAKSPVAEAELAWHNSLPIPNSMMPKLIVNNQLYNGDLTCADPLTPECSPLQMVCAGFMTGTQPDACSSPLDCPLGSLYDACNTCRVKGDPSWVTDPTLCNVQPDTGKSGGGGIGVGAVIGIIVAAVVLIAGGVYFYMRRQQTKMKDDIDSLLKQYLPLDGPPDSRAAPRVDQSRLLAPETESDQI